MALHPTSPASLARRSRTRVSARRWPVSARPRSLFCSTNREFASDYFRAERMLESVPAGTSHHQDSEGDAAESIAVSAENSALPSRVTWTP
jgi:hypothetical protein